MKPGMKDNTLLQEYLYLYEKAFKEYSSDLSWIVTSFILIAFAILFNLTEIVILSRKKQRRIYDDLIRSLSWADLLTSIGYGLWIILVRSAHHNLKPATLYIMLALFGVFWFSVWSSLIHVIAVATDRLLCILWPFRHRSWCARRSCSSFIIMALWLLSLTFTSGAISENFNHAARILTAVLTGMVVIVNISILFGLFKQFRPSLGQTNKNPITQRKERLALVMSGLITASFIICNVPFAIKLFVNPQKTKVETVLVLTNSLLNSLIYFFKFYLGKRGSNRIRVEQLEGGKRRMSVYVDTNATTSS